MENQSNQTQDTQTNLAFISPESDVQQRIKRAESQIRDLAAVRNECLAMYRGEHYLFKASSLISSDTTMKDTARLIGGTSRLDPSKARGIRNLIPDFVRREVSIATTRAPVFDVLPTGTDRQKVEAANIAQKVALYGYGKWNFRDMITRAATMTIIMGESFAWPYFDTTIGPYIQGNVGIGDIRIKVLHANQVGWQPGVTFLDARWYVIQHVMPIDELVNMPGYMGGKLVGDATNSTIINTPTDDDHSLVFVTEYIERPCPKYPNGRRVTIANERKIFEDRTYPLVDRERNVIDEPFLVRLVKDVDPENDRPRSLVADLVDPQRAINNIESSKLEAKNLGLVPQMVTKNLRPSIPKVEPVPGSIYHLRGDGDFGWVPPPPAQIFSNLEDMKQSSINDMGRIAAQNDPPKNIESSKALQVYNERDVSARAIFLSNTADFYAEVMRRCLILMQIYATEPRLIRINGENGSETIENFTGAQLADEIDVRVSPASIEPRTREGVSQLAIQLLQMGKIDTQRALLAIQSGSLEKLTESYDKDVARANRVIQSLKEGPEVFLSGSGMPSPDGSGELVPDFMPRKFDNVSVHKQVFEDWMKSVDFENLDEAVREAALTYYEGLESLEQRRAAAEQQQQIEMAQGLGMANAAKPTSAGQPSLPTPDG